ncbi:uncharacterized protein LOC121792992 isoform X2 [Salvia splendens]|uniref:uncharacterized protein LOC121792992 isoform X2 n=1 Tax=Salvia splendens TaxID=180675 RepID=UPI001C28075F|nr:uncharacterized protein LOC121792992 isoform X2 [Salvia splendens]
MSRTSASYGKKAHEQVKEKKLVEAEMEFESSFSSHSSVCLLHPHTSPPTASTYTNNTRFFKHKPKTSSSSSSSTWERFKSLCIASLPLMDSSSLLESKKNKYITNAALPTQKRDELEREVSVLNKMLAHEQKVHEYLERIHDRKDGSALTIPNFLPPKTKETLAELAMVENEITRLESQIKHLQHLVKREKEDNIDKKYKEWGRAGPPKPLHDHPNKRTNDHKPAFDTKALHFINKAINGDFHNSKAPPNPRRAALLKHPSPLREPRNPTPRRDRVYDVPPDYLTRVSSTPLHTEEESIHRLTPNKLSERIMKCLVFIYMRLLRTSRVMELEKSGSIARSTNFSLSFRAEANSNSKTGLTLHKDSRQQDPYGILDSEASVPRDIGPYKNLVRFTSSSMDLKCIQNSSSVPLFQKLKVMMDGLQKVDLRFMSHQQKLAFWINMYNACIMHGYLQYGVPSVLNHDSLLNLINKATLNVAGNTINAPAIERFILRKPQEALVKEILGKENESKEMIVGDLYGLETPDPNIIFALCCGTRSSPAVKIYTAEGVTAELERSKQEYLQAAIMVSGGAKKIALPDLLLTNMSDFAADKESLMEWVCQQLPTSGALRKSIVDCFRSFHGGKGAAAAVVEKIAYEFEFQYLLVV